MGWEKRDITGALSRKNRGTAQIVNLFRGEGDKLLWELKRQMGNKDVKTLSMRRVFSDGTVIIVSSSFGQDRIFIDTSRSDREGGIDGEKAFCVLTFIDFPQFVPPMRNPGGILDTEVAGVDYIKTYYIPNVEGCQLCIDKPDITVTFQFLDSSYEELSAEGLDENPHDHCLISEDGGCSGEIIKIDSDEDGRYFTWKVYTEGGPKTRSGLGFARLRAEIKDTENTVVCYLQVVVEVDCCLREDRLGPKIYWRQWDGMPSGCLDPVDKFGERLCRVPNKIGISDIIKYAQSFSDGLGRFYSIPEAGGCLNYIWESSGYGFLSPGDGLGEIEIYHPGSGTVDCNAFFIMTVNDRCGENPYSVQALACCGLDPAPVAIEYTSLIQSCGSGQTFYVKGGCPPYSWTMEDNGGGTLVVGADGYSATYTAPAVNVDCLDNPTMTVRDCCGSVADVKIAVNCVAAGIAFYQYSAIFNGVEFGLDQCVGGPGCNLVDLRSSRRPYRCDMLLLGDYLVSTACAPGGYTFGGHECDVAVGDRTQMDPCKAILDAFLGVDCATPCGPGFPCGYIQDVRTPAQIAAGCCPINPSTGLPF